jgi:hypothetical protein
MIKAGRLLVVRDAGTTMVIANFPGTAPPREGRAPTIHELLVERMGKPSVKALPEGVHRGRPRLRPLDAAE